MYNELLLGLRLDDNVRCATEFLLMIDSCFNPLILRSNVNTRCSGLYGVLGADKKKRSGERPRSPGGAARVGKKGGRFRWLPRQLDAAARSLHLQVVTDPLWVLSSHTQYGVCLMKSQ